MIKDYYKIPFLTYRVSASIDTNNAPAETNSLYISSFGYLDPLSGTERYLSERVHEYANYRLFTSVIDITESDTIVINGINYDIDFIANLNNDHLEIILIQRHNS